MIEVLQFVFSGFWIWLGFAILLSIATAGFAQAFMALASIIGSMRA